MKTLSVRTLENALAAKARAYLIKAHRLPDAAAAALAQRAASTVIAELGQKAIEQGQPAVIRAARQMAMALPGRAGSRATTPPMPAAHGRPMREQLLDPLTLSELGNRSRQEGQRLMNRLPIALAAALGPAVARASSVTPPDSPV